MLERLATVIQRHRLPVLGSLVHVQRGKPNVPANRRHRERFVQVYAEAASRIPQVTDIRATDNVSYIDVVTSYRGDIRAIEDELYRIEAETQDRFPDVRVDWHFVKADETLPSSARVDAEILASG